VTKAAPVTIGASMITCQLCGEPTMYRLSNGALICVQCVDRFQREQNAAMIDFLLGEIGSGGTVGNIGPGVEISKRVPRRQPTALTNIRLDRSVVGAINTGRAQAIDVALSYIKQKCDPGVSELLQEFTQAVLDDRELDQAMRGAIIEQLSFLISQTLAKQGQKRPSIVNAVLKSIKESLSISSGLITVWDKLEPCLRQVLALNAAG
jgi:hypothetical protein